MGGLNNWKGREVEVDLSFLPEGTYQISSFVDGFNANTIAQDFRVVKSTGDNKQKIKVRMANGGGFAMKLTPVK